MQGVKTRNKNEEALLAEAETQELKEPTAIEKKKFQESVANLVEAFSQEYSIYAPPYRKMLYWFLFARTEKKMPPKEIIEQLKTTNRENFEYCVGKFDAIAGEIPAIGQQIILAKLLKNLEPEEAEYEKEAAHNEAFDKVLDAISEWTTEELLSLAGRIKNGALGMAIKRVVSQAG
jgi:hypothetical protein